MLRLHKHKALVKDSRIFQETRTAVEALGVTRIRCLALGSPCTETQAPYQLAYLVAVAELLGIAPANVSVYDPVFNAADRSLLEEVGFVEEAPDRYVPAPKDTLYYMPHCPRSVAEEVFRKEEPQFVLGNDISVVIGTLSAGRFLEEYPLLAHMNKMYEDQRGAEPEKPVSDAGAFTVVRKKKGRKQYVPPVLEYDYSRVYCKKVDVVRIHSEAGVWRNSFSDLALNIIATEAT